MQADLVLAITNVLKQPEARDLLREPDRMLPVFLMPGDNPENRGDLPVSWQHRVVQLSPDPDMRAALSLHRVPVTAPPRSGNSTGLPHHPEVIPAGRRRQPRSLRHQARPGTSPEKRLPRGRNPGG